MPLPTVSILGCGWLGLPLGLALTQRGYAVKGSTAHKDKIGLLQKAHIVPYLLECQPQCAGERIEEFFQSDILIITLPFKRSFVNPEYYKDQIKGVLEWVSRSKRCSFVIFTSSTSVYPSDFPVASEDSTFTPDNSRAHVLWSIEQLLLHHSSCRATILRLAGLYGPERLIGNLMKARVLEKGDGPVNLIHRDDVIAIILEVINKDIRGEIFNVCADEHPLRKILYSEIARRQGLPEPVFREALSGKKIVSNLKIKERLGYRLLHPDPMEDISS